jgi:hypothetical protein
MQLEVASCCSHLLVKCFYPLLQTLSMAAPPHPPCRRPPPFSLPCPNLYPSPMRWCISLHQGDPRRCSQATSSTSFPLFRRFRMCFWAKPVRNSGGGAPDGGGPVVWGGAQPSSSSYGGVWRRHLESGDRAWMRGSGSAKVGSIRALQGLVRVVMAWSGSFRARLATPVSTPTP